MKYLALFLLSSALACADDFATGQAARITIGQPNFTAQETAAPSQFQLGGVSGVAYANGTLLVTDANRVQAAPVQNRVLIYNNISRFVRNPADEVPQGIRCPVCAGDPDVGGADFVIGQPDFSSTDLGLSQTQLRLPTAVATNGQIVVVADTDNNRVLIWNSIPQSNGVPADIVLGQPDFKTVKQPPAVDNKSLRGPQGVWIQGARLYVADTQNNRVMVWNSIPTANNQAADLVLGVPSFTTPPQPVINKTQAPATANNMLSPVSVTSDGARLFVTDLGYNRVLVWNSIPAQTQQPADLALGQPDLTSSFGNNSSALCPSTPDSAGKPVFPTICAATLDFPRFALSDGRRLFIADGGNDRVLIYNTLPTQSGARADVILGQRDEFTDQVTDDTNTLSPDNLLRSSADTIRTPLSLAFDGVNLFVSDPFDRRVLVFTVGQNTVSSNAITNSASRTVFALGTLDFAGAITADDTVTVTIQGKAYVYKVLKADTLATVIAALVTQINSGPDPNVFVRANPGFNEIVLTAKAPGQAGNLVAYSVTLSTNATIQVVAGATNLVGGESAADLAPGTLVTINGTNLSDTTASADLTQQFLPRKLGGVEVYFDGIKAPLLYVSPTQINTQLPFDVIDASSVSSYVRVEHADGSVTTSTAVAIPVVEQNPGIFALEGTDPRPAIAFHSTNHATAVVDVNGGAIHAGDVATLTIGANKYTYTVLAADTFATVRDALIVQVNANADEVVTAEPAGQFFRILLRAKATGADGNGITVTAAVTGTAATLTLTALQATTCCASGDATGLPVDDTNPARPGEIITIFAAGLGPVGPDAIVPLVDTGMRFDGPALNSAISPVADAQAGGLTANVLFAGLKPGTIGIYEVQLQLSPSLPTNPQTQLFIAQDVFTSNVVTIPVVVPPTS